MRDSSAFLVDMFGPGKKAITSRAPGRVNLIGEHTDYNGGYVLPFAIDKGTVVALRPRVDKHLIVYAAAFDEEMKASLPLDSPTPTGTWRDYVIGILLELQKLDDLPFGFEGVIIGDIPLGAGLSSSASLEVALTVCLSQLYSIELHDLELIRLCQHAENDYVGIQSGIMDQYVSFLARDGTAMLLDTGSLEHEYIPLQPGDISFLVVDSAVRRSLSSSGYNDRRRECQQSLELLRKRFVHREIRWLSDLRPGELENIEKALPRILAMRVRHIIEENSRVLQSVAELQRGDFSAVGKLLFASHASLRDLFQVSTKELDFLVTWARENGALGARMVGGGFGGVTLHLVKENELAEYAEKIKAAYQAAFRLAASTLRVYPYAGAKQLAAEKAVL